jgi:large subunit ribosomal protein L25
MDFLAVSLKEKVRTLVNVFVEGVAPAIQAMGAVIVTGADQIEVEALPQELPESFVVDVSVLESIGDGIYVRDLVMPEGVECLSEPEEMLVVATAPVLEEEEEEEVEEEELDEDVEPEVIEKGKKEEEQEDKEG